MRDQEKDLSQAVYEGERRLGMFSSFAPERHFVIKVAHVRGEPWQGEEADYELISLNLK